MKRDTAGGLDTDFYEIVRDIDLFSICLDGPMRNFSKAGHHSSTNLPATRSCIVEYRILLQDERMNLVRSHINTSAKVMLPQEAPEVPRPSMYQHPYLLVGIRCYLNKVIATA
jgi:hypothetical protein